MPRTWLSLFTTQLADPDMGDFMRNIELTMDDWIHEILQLVAVDVKTYLVSYTSKVNPPRYKRRYTLVNDVRTKVTKKMGINAGRPAHPGGWSDVEGDLRDKYYARVEKAPTGGWRLVVGNRSDHAVYVEAMDGLFVVTGIFDVKGPVYKAINKYLKLYAPGAKIISRTGGIEVNDKGTGIIDSVTAGAL